MAKSRGYYLTITARVYDDPDLSDSSKLFYGLISSLTNERGYCYGSDLYLSERSGKASRTVRRLISELEAKDHVIVETEPRTDGSGGSNRRIWLKDSYREKSPLNNVSGDYRSKMTATPTITPEEEGVPAKNDRYVPVKNDRSYITKNKQVVNKQEESSNTPDEEEIGLILPDPTPSVIRQWEGKQFWSDRDNESHGQVIREFISKYDAPDPINFAWAWRQAFGFRPSPLIQREVLDKILLNATTPEERTENWNKIIASVAVAANAGLSGSPKAINTILKSWADNPPGRAKGTIDATGTVRSKFPTRYYTPNSVRDLKKCGARKSEVVGYFHPEIQKMVYALSDSVRSSVINDMIDKNLPEIKVSDWPKGLELYHYEDDKKEVAA